MPYINTNNISKAIIVKRIHELDNDASVWFSQNFDEGTDSIIQVVDTDSNLDATIINQTIQQSVTQAEIDWLSEIQSIKLAYQNMITRLEQIQTTSNPTNTQVIQAVKDEALYIERIMKAIKTII